MHFLKIANFVVSLAFMAPMAIWGGRIKNIKPWIVGSIVYTFIILVVSMAQVNLVIVTALAGIIVILIGIGKTLRGSGYIDFHLYVHHHLIIWVTLTSFCWGDDYGGGSGYGRNNLRDPLCRIFNERGNRLGDVFSEVWVLRKSPGRFVPE